MFFLYFCKHIHCFFLIKLSIIVPAMKMKYNSLPFCLLLLGSLILASCKHDMFDPNAYQQLINYTAPIGNIDPAHTWNLTRSYSIQVQLNTQQPVDKVQILSGNPNEREGVEILAEQSDTLGNQVIMFFYAPICQNDFYAAVVTTDGKYLMKAFNSSEQVVVIDDDAIMQSGSFKSPDYQTYTYCFEEEYPKPSDDWDYNDLVLRIQKVPAQADNEVRLKVTIAAVGASKQLAAAIRLVGYDWIDVAAVGIEEGRTFDGAYNQQRQLIKDASLLLRGQNGEAVLNLFEDAHWAMSPRLKSDGGGVLRMFYNTLTNVDGTSSAQLRPKTLTYVIKLRNPRLLSNFTLETLDPFIIEDFNSGKWEVHLYEYKKDGVLHDYGDNATATSNSMVWALKIPSGTFRWPQEGIGMGYYREGVLTGAYMEYGHSFGQWVVNHKSSLDWFRHPSTGLVY